MRSKPQSLWHCSRCSSVTIVNNPLNPESIQELYGIEPEELDGTIIMEPLILSCDETLVKK